MNSNSRRNTHSNSKWQTDWQPVVPWDQHFSQSLNRWRGNSRGFGCQEDLENRTRSQQFKSGSSADRSSSGFNPRRSRNAQFSTNTTFYGMYRSESAPPPSGRSRPEAANNHFLWSASQADLYQMPPPQRSTYQPRHWEGSQSARASENTYQGQRQVTPRTRTEQTRARNFRFADPETELKLLRSRAVQLGSTSTAPSGRQSRYQDHNSSMWESGLTGQDHQRSGLVRVQDTEFSQRSQSEYLRPGPTSVVGSRYGLSWSESEIGSRYQAEFENSDWRDAPNVRQNSRPMHRSASFHLGASAPMDEASTNHRLRESRYDAQDQQWRPVHRSASFHMESAPWVENPGYQSNVRSGFEVWEPMRRRAHTSPGKHEESSGRQFSYASPVWQHVSAPIYSSSSGWQPPTTNLSRFQHNNRSSNNRRFHPPGNNSRHRNSDNFGSSSFAHQSC